MFLFSQKISADLKGPKLKYKLRYGQSKIPKIILFAFSNVLFVAMATRLIIFKEFSFSIIQY